ncbi:MAG TPA: secondary thiamine-phosphate synthase enzyme YjbQ [Gaiellaceae bacterium]|nr:secondary thiamine-phosphate synthase enzyme YjbQ [Gaiellaceae bacterium]
MLREFEVRTERKTQVVDVTQGVRQALGDADGASAALVYVPHTTAGVIVQEHADPAVGTDLEKAMEKIVEDGWGWDHIEEGEENAPSHVRAALTATSVLIPLRAGDLALGTWQGVFFCEFDGPRTRKVYVTTLS